MRRTTTFAGSAAALAALLATAGCSSSGTSTRPSTADLTPTTATSPSSQAPSTPSTPSTPTTSARPLSAFEQDPAVRALRAWAAQAGRTVNSGRYDDAALNALMTKSFRKGMKDVLGGEVRFRYPGPIPFTPTTVTVTDSANRDVHMCVVFSGFSLSRKTGRPAQQHHVQAVDAGATNVGGTWLVSKFRIAQFSCKGVKIEEVKY